MKNKRLVCKHCGSGIASYSENPWEDSEFVVEFRCGRTVHNNPWPDPPQKVEETPCRYTGPECSAHIRAYEEHYYDTSAPACRCCGTTDNIETLDGWREFCCDCAEAICSDAPCTSCRSYSICQLAASKEMTD